MNAKKIRSAELRALCGELHADDGVDPRTAFARGYTKRGGRSLADRDRRATNGDIQPNHKTLQLCKQAARAIQAAFRGGAGDRLLCEIEVVAVSPSSDGARLVVHVRSGRGAPPIAAAQLLARLTKARGFLRAALAAAITRKRVPELTFRIAGAAEEEGR